MLIRSMQTYFMQVDERNRRKNTNKTEKAHVTGLASALSRPGWTQFKHQNKANTLCLSAGLGTPWAPPGGDGGGVWEEGRLGVSAESAAPATRSRISGRGRVRVHIKTIRKKRIREDRGCQKLDSVSICCGVINVRRSITYCNVLPCV
ncbi:hypothetical protein XENOCAPTIV_030526 [Xenoophorus captivus]|uniref:Uncharacterized protein n=1 Tax=Xenoophorus captivus TaxID=1517983 RepID=A0ABV0R5N8_9TELE